MSSFKVELEPVIMNRQPELIVTVSKDGLSNTLMFKKPILLEDVIEKTEELKLKHKGHDAKKVS